MDFVSQGAPTIFFLNSLIFSSTYFNIVPGVRSHSVRVFKKLDLS